ncbi:hypothetical protein OsJ_07051 [Oryza sativa Japonica Group]|uniref:U-box domain-containing protein n=1 Tax=Oryza sativa subsp. japonica TaxID=39947 RepID=B9F0F3_ORYSJ|nr:hypothetical protein OsJ_07051 [Oryza sativa Japonica Group]
MDPSSSSSSSSPFSTPFHSISSTSTLRPQLAIAIVATPSVCGRNEIEQQPSMVRKEMGGGGGRLAAEYQGLEVKVPTFFRCPISLDVMRSPVSLCTGVTYDRASIQRWIDSGNTTCPATMLPLPSTDLVPNLTLRRLIALWASTAAPSSPAAPSAVGPTPAAAAAELLRRVAAPGVEPVPGAAQARGVPV